MGTDRCTIMAWQQHRAYEPFVPETNCQLTTRKPWSFAPGHDSHGAHGPVGTEVSGSSAFRGIQQQREKLTRLEQKHYEDHVAAEQKAFREQVEARKQAYGAGHGVGYGYGYGHGYGHGRVCGPVRVHTRVHPPGFHY